MSEELLVRHCSPTLAGIKTGNMFNCSFENSEKMKESIRKLNGVFAKKGLRILPLRYRNNSALIYVYRPSKLSQDLQDDTACRLLEERGYATGVPESCILHLIHRLSSSEEFPHEIGLFLGYPPEDVCGFIENRAEGCKCVGCWKVYSDEEAAQKTFEKFKKCTTVYCEQWAKGRSIERLTVAV